MAARCMRAHDTLRAAAADRVSAASAWYRNTDGGAGEAAEPLAPRRPHRIHLVLDNVRSAYNVGSIFRSADTAGAAEVVTCGFTPHPPHPKLAKVWMAHGAWKLADDECRMANDE